jgi:hypothetical protein
MASRKPSAKARLAEYLAHRQPVPLAEDEFESLLGLLAPVSRSYLRTLLRRSGAPLAPLVEGVRQDSPGELERTLKALETVYRRAREAGDAERQRLCRRLVIEAKDHARWALRRGKLGPDQAAWRREAIDWMLVWLENPEAFPVWAALRRRRLESAAEAAHPEPPAGR